MLNIFYTNARSIFSKFDDLQIKISENNPDLILITETWCNDSISNAMLHIDGYSLNEELRCDRKDTANGIGGGLLVYSKNCITIKSVLPI